MKGLLVLISVVLLQCLALSPQDDPILSDRGDIEGTLVRIVVGPLMDIGTGKYYPESNEVVWLFTNNSQWDVLNSPKSFASFKVVDFNGVGGVNIQNVLMSGIFNSSEASPDTTIIENYDGGLKRTSMVYSRHVTLTPGRTIKIVRDDYLNGLSGRIDLISDLLTNQYDSLTILYPRNISSGKE